MCGIAGVRVAGSITAEDRATVSRMIAALHHRGPDQRAIVDAGEAILASARLAIVDREGGSQPFTNRDKTIRVVYNGEIYNHRELREELLVRGYPICSQCDGEVIAHLYELYGTAFVDRIDGQFAIALMDEREGSLVLVRDRLGICPLYWMCTRDAFYFASEIKAFYAGCLAPKRLNTTALLQLSYFGAVCAPITPFDSVYALPPAHWMRVGAGGERTVERYWRLSFPAMGHERRMSEDAAADMLLEHLRTAVSTHAQGDAPVAAFLSGGVDSSAIAALLASHQGAAETHVFCATSPVAAYDESEEAAQSAAYFGVQFHGVQINGADIAASFERLLYHTETPMTSTEASALMALSGRAKGHAKVVLTGEGADEAFAGYLAFRQQQSFGFLTERRFAALRAAARSVLQRYYGTDCLVPGEKRLRALYEHAGFFPAQAYEWEFYRAAIGAVLSPEYARMLDRDEQWNGLDIASDANRKMHRLNRSLDIAYQIMLPNYLLGPHGDRVLAANSVEGRYPFLAREVVEFAASLDPRLKLNRRREKYVLRCAAQRVVPPSAAWRKKHRFTMPFGTPFLGPDAPEIYSYLLAPGTIASYGYFDVSAVARTLRRMCSQAPRSTAASIYLDRLALGIAVTVIVSTQLWHYIFVENASNLLAPCGAAQPAGAATA